MATNLGKVMITTEGKYVPGVLYKEKSIVTHNENTYISLKDTAEEPSDDGMNWMMLLEGVPIAKNDTVGKVKPDGETITIDEDGTLHGASQVPEGVTFVDLDSEDEKLPGKLPIDADTLGGKAPAYFASAEEVSDFKDKILKDYDTLERNNNQKYGMTYISGKSGWYRIAAYESTSGTHASGSTSNAVELFIKRGYGYTPAEYHHLVLLTTFNGNSEFRELYGKSSNKIITHIRHVVRKTAIDGVYGSYIDIYYNADVGNNVSVALDFTKTSHGETGWVPGSFQLVDEASDDEVVYAKYAIQNTVYPVNSSDLSNYLALGGGTISGLIRVRHVDGYWVNAINDETQQDLILNYTYPKSHVYVYSGGTNGEALHSGNSRPVSISTTAPTNIYALWYNPSTKAVKSYVDGAWT